jgi:hypothetical protein
MKMIGISKPSLERWSCSSIPPMFGICTSRIRHRVSDNDDDCRNNSADANVRVLNPSDLTRLSIAARTVSSSSTIDISGISVNRSSRSRSKNGWRRCFDEALDDHAMEPALKEYDLGASGAIDESVVSTDTETFSDHD